MRMVVGLLLAKLNSGELLAQMVLLPIQYLPPKHMLLWLQKKILGKILFLVRILILRLALHIKAVLLRLRGLLYVSKKTVGNYDTSKF